MAVDRRSSKGRRLARAKRAFGVVHRSAYRVSGGRIGGRTNGAPVLLLTTTGRRSGKARTVPLVYAEDDGGYVVAASNAGHWDPAWYRNLQAQPSATIEVGRTRRSARAELADEVESRRLWAVIEEINPAFAAYPVSLGHEVPMVVLRPEAGAAS